MGGVRLLRCSLLNSTFAAFAAGFASALQLVQVLSGRRYNHCNYLTGGPEVVLA